MLDKDLDKLPKKTNKKYRDKDPHDFWCDCRYCRGCVNTSVTSWKRYRKTQYRNISMNK